jgi:hypothetical protein
MSSSGTWRCVDLVRTDVSEERIASIFKVEKSVSKEPAWASGTRLQTTCSCWLLAVRYFYPEVGGDTFLRNVGSHKIYTASHSRKRHSSDQSSAYHPSYLSKIHFSIIHPPTSRSSYCYCFFVAFPPISYTHSLSPPFVLHALSRNVHNKIKNKPNVALNINFLCLHENYSLRFNPFFVFPLPPCKSHTDSNTHICLCTCITENDFNLSKILVTAQDFSQRNYLIC